MRMCLDCNRITHTLHESIGILYMCNVEAGESRCV